MGTEASVQVAPDSTGKKIRNLSVQAVQADGTIATVQMQVISLADADGSPLRLADDRDVQQQLLMELRAVRHGMQQLVEWLNPEASVVRTQPIPGGASVPLLALTAADQELIEIAKDDRDQEDT